MIEVDQRDRDQQQHQDDAEDRVLVEPLVMDDQRAQETGHGLY